MSTDIPLRPLKKNSSDSRLAALTSRMASSSRRKQQQRYLDTPEDEVNLLESPGEDLENAHDDVEVEEPVVRTSLGNCALAGNLIRHSCCVP